MANGVSPVAVPGKSAGEVFIPALGKTFRQVELREDDVIDSVQVVSGTIQDDKTYILFRDIQNKSGQHTSIGTTKRLNSNDEAAIFRIGIHMREAHGNTVPILNDYKKIVGNGYLDLKFNRRVVTQGPVIKYQSGYGLGGYSFESGATAVSIGVPSAGAAPTLFVPQQLTDTDDINGELKFPAASWITGYANAVLAGDVIVTCLLHGIIKSPLGA